MFLVIFILLFVHQTHCNQASSFLPLLTSNGSPLCAFGNPSDTIQTNDIIGIPCGVPGATKCAFYCTGLNSRITCVGFNYLTSGLCQFFSNQLNYWDSKIQGCTYYYQVTDPTTSSFKQVSPSVNNSCSFPYTYQGLLYYECTVFKSTNGTLDIGCYSTGGMRSCDPSKCYGVDSNIALNRPAYQLNTYQTSNASYAVDGNAATASCTRQVDNSPSWWSVDLGQLYNVITVFVSDDSDPKWFFRMAYFYTWLSNTQPTVGQPLDTSKCFLCRQYSGTFSTTQLTVNVTCQLSLTKFRYIILQTSQPNTPMCLVEVQVYAGFIQQTINVTIPTTNNKIPLMSVNGWRTIMSRINSKFPCALNWTMYKNGFGDIASNFWLGLERIFQLANINTNGGRMFRLRFELQSNASNSWYSEEYDWFYIESEAQFYKLHVSLSAVGDAGDSLNSPLDPRKAANGMSFSSRDVDNDLSSGNCAKVYGGGWWYNGCSNSKHLGISDDGHVWGTLSPSESRLMASRMMIKSIT